MPQNQLALHAGWVLFSGMALGIFFGSVACLFLGRAPHAQGQAVSLVVLIADW